MATEPDIIKKLREEERLGILKSSIQQSIDYPKKIDKEIKNSNEQNIVLSQKSNLYEDTFQDFFENANDLIQAVRPDGSFLYVNPAWKKTLGYSDEEIKNLNVFDIIHKDSIDHCKKVFGKIMNGINIDRIQTTFISKSGEKIYLEGSISCRFIDGKPYSTRGIFRDITKRKKAEDKFRMLFNSSVDAIFLHNLDDLSIVDVNDEACKRFEYSREELLKMSINDLSEGSAFSVDAPESKKLFKKLLSGEIITHEWLSKTKSGKLLWHELNAKIIEFDGKKLMLVSVRDITERKNTLNELERSEEKFKILYESSTDAIMTLSPPDWKFTGCNKAALKIFNVKKEDKFKTLGPWDVSPEFQSDGGKSSEKAKKMIMEAMEKGSKYFEWTHKKLDGEPFFATVLLTRVKLGDKSFIQATVRDITAEKESQEYAKIILETMADGLLYMKPNGIIIDVNPSFVKIFGYKNKKDFFEHVKSPLDMVFENEKATMINAIKDTIEKGSDKHEYKGYRKDGSTCIVSVQAALFDNVYGEKSIVANVRDVTKEKIVEEEIKQSGERLKNIIDTVQAGIILIDEKTHNILEVNNLASEMIGLPKEKIIGRLCHSFICPAQKGKCPISDLKKSVDKSERVLIGKDKNEIKVLKTVKPIKLGSKKVLLESFVDITNLKKAEKETEDVLNAAADGIRIVGKSYNIVKVNDTFAEMCGVSLDKIKGKKCRDVFSSEKCGTKDCALATVLRTKKSFQREQIMTTKDGKKIPCLLKAIPYKDGEGNIIGIIEDYRDISYLKEAQEKIKKSYDIINKSPVVAFTWKNEEGWPVDYVSDNVKDLFGYSTKEFTEGKIEFSKTIHPDDLERVGYEVEKYSEDKECKEFEQEYRIITKKGAEKWIYDRTMIRRDEKGNPVFFDGIILDVTEDKRKENELKEKIEELERYKKVTVGRELKMIELKEKIKNLEDGSDGDK